MRWKAIGESVTGSSHTKNGRPCEDRIRFGIVPAVAGAEALVCCISDGAGSARYAAEAAQYVTHTGFELLAAKLLTEPDIKQAFLFNTAEKLYDGLKASALEKGTEINEFSCTLLGCVVLEEQAAFFQIGDGAIARNDGSGYYTPVWLPHNGEYQNTTSFLIDDSNFPHFKTTILHEPVSEVAIFTDGLQMLTMNTEAGCMHQPFFTDLFRWLRMVETEEEQAILQQKLSSYLGSNLINSRTDDDKTLFLATSVKNDRANS